MKTVGIIPSRLKSTRLPQKSLIDIEGLPMIIHVLKRAQLSSALDEVFVATDSREIYDAVTDYGGKAVMSSGEHSTGTDRIAQAATDMRADIVVNIQGDEPLLNPDHICQVVDPFRREEDLQVAVLVTPFAKKNSFSDIKAVLDAKNNILFCSRRDLPSAARTAISTMWKMSFIVPFRKSFLLRYASWEQTPLEKVECNEYLRILERGYKIRAIHVDHAEISVDTPEDLEIVREQMKADKVKNRYLDSA